MTCRSRTSSRAARLALVATVLVLPACSSDSDPGTLSAPTPSAAGSPAAESTPSPTPAAPTTPAASSPTAAPGTVTITYAGGKVTGAQDRTRVKLGDNVTLRITSDVADEVHVHGYDKYADVAAGGTATLTFKASIPGVYEVELEKIGALLTRLQVQ